MSSAPTRCVTRANELKAKIRAQVTYGWSISVSKVIRSALLLKIDRKLALFSALNAGEQLTLDAPRFQTS